MKTGVSVTAKKEEIMRTKSFGIVVVVLMLVVGLTASQASAQRLLGTLNTGTDSVPVTSTLIELDPATGGLVSTIGDVGYAVNGMTWDAVTGTLWATTTNWDPTFPDGLIIIDPMTAAATTVGSGAGQLVNVPTTNSTGQVYGWTEDTDDPVLWNTATGTVTVLGASGIQSRLQGLDFDATDTLYLVQDFDWNGDGQSVYTINTTTGAATAVGALPSLPNGYAHHGKFHPVTNLYYGIDAAGGRVAPPRNLLVIDIGTLSVVNTIPTVDYLHTLVFMPTQLQLSPIPVLGPWSIALLILLLASVAVILIRNRLA